MVTIQIQQLVVQPGQRIQLRDVDWAEFEAILAELGDRRPPSYHAPPSGGCDRSTKSSRTQPIAPDFSNFTWYQPY